MNREIQHHIVNNQYLKALKIVDKLVIRHNEYYLLRALLRELVNDLETARRDIISYEGLDENKDIIHARILAKLGYVDQSNEILKNISILYDKKDEYNIPISYGIVYKDYDLKRLGISKLSQALECREIKKSDPVIFNGIIYTLQMLGAYDIALYLLSNDKDYNIHQEIIKNLIKHDNLPSIESLENEKNLFRKKLNKIRGWLSPIEATLLSLLAETISSNQNIVEIGSFCGRSTVSLAIGSKKGNISKVFAIDPHQGILSYGVENTYSSLRYNLKAQSLENFVKIIRKKSTHAFKNWKYGKIGLLFIDALHDYENVKMDFIKWSEYIVDGGLLLFHDSVQNGVTKLLIEILINDNNYEPLGLRDSIFVFKKNYRYKKSQKDSFYVSFLKEKNNDYIKWLEREKKIIIHSALSCIIIDKT